MSEGPTVPKAPSKKKYLIGLVISWVYTAAWSAALVILVRYGSEISTGWIWGIGIFLSITVPSLKDLASLFEGFDSYVERVSVAPGYSWNDPIVGAKVTVISAFKSIDKRLMGSVALGTENWQAEFEGHAETVPPIGEVLIVVGRDGNTLSVRRRSDA